MIQKVEMIPISRRKWEAKQPLSCDLHGRASRFVRSEGFGGWQDGLGDEHGGNDDCSLNSAQKHEICKPVEVVTKKWIP